MTQMVTNKTISTYRSKDSICTYINIVYDQSINKTKICMATSMMNKLNLVIKAVVMKDHLSILHIVRYTTYRKQKEFFNLSTPMLCAEGLLWYPWVSSFFFFSGTQTCVTKVGLQILKSNGVCFSANTSSQGLWVSPAWASRNICRQVLKLWKDKKLSRMTENINWAVQYLFNCSFSDQSWPGHLKSKVNLQEH